jgi:hypothetical protein
VTDRDDPEVEVAARLEREAQQVIAAATGDRNLTQALEQLRADRANGESLGTAIEHLQRALERFGNT